jgi:hypothetical protein
MKLPEPRDPGELSTIARARLVAAYAAFSAGHLDDAFEMFNEAGKACAEACRAVGRISAARKEQR